MPSSPTPILLTHTCDWRSGALRGLRGGGASPPSQGKSVRWPWPSGCLSLCTPVFPFSPNQTFMCPRFLSEWRALRVLFPESNASSSARWMSHPEAPEML